MTEDRDRFTEQLNAYLDGELDDQQRQAVEDRLTHDTDARAELNNLRERVRLIKNLPRESAPSDLLGNILTAAQTTDENVHRRTKPRSTLHTLRSITLVAAALALCVTVGLWSASLTERPNRRVAVSSIEPDIRNRAIETFESIQSEVAPSRPLAKSQPTQTAITAMDEVASNEPLSQSPQLAMAESESPPNSLAGAVFAAANEPNPATHVPTDASPQSAMLTIVSPDRNDADRCIRLARDFDTRRTAGYSGNLRTRYEFSDSSTARRAIENADSPNETHITISADHLEDLIRQLDRNPTRSVTLVANTSPANTQHEKLARRSRLHAKKLERSEARRNGRSVLHDADRKPNRAFSDHRALGLQTATPTTAAGIAPTDTPIQLTIRLIVDPESAAAPAMRPAPHESKSPE